jgi:hypothetical protein
MLIDLLLMAGLIAAFMLLSPCSPLSVWRKGSCAWKPQVPPPATKPDAGKPH